jgi:hypothetical protein
MVATSSMVVEHRFASSVDLRLPGADSDFVEAG